MIINHTEKWDSSHVNNNIFSEKQTIFFCRNDVQAIDFLRKGSYAPDIIKDHQTNVLCILHVGKNVRVKLEKKSLFPASSILCCFIP